MNVGDTIVWRSRGGEREGTVVRFIAPHRDVLDLLPPPTPGARATYRLRTPIRVSPEPRVLLRCHRWGRLRFGPCLPRCSDCTTLRFHPDNPHRNDFCYYAPTLRWLQRTGARAVERKATMGKPQ